MKYLCTNCLTVNDESEVIEHTEQDVNYTELRCYECDSEKLKDLNGDAVKWLVGQIYVQDKDSRKCLYRLADIANGEYA